MRLGTFWDWGRFRVGTLCLGTFCIWDDSRLGRFVLRCFVGVPIELIVIIAHAKNLAIIRK